MTVWQNSLAHSPVIVSLLPSQRDSAFDYVLTAAEQPIQIITFEFTQKLIEYFKQHIRPASLRGLGVAQCRTQFEKRFI